MKTKNVLFTTVLTIALTLPMFGQPANTDTTKTDMKKHDMSSMRGKPTFEATTEGLHMKVWLMTQKEHIGMKDTSMGMDKATREAMMAGTHHIMLDVTDAASGKEISNARAKVQVVSPSKKSSLVDLKTMMSHFGSGLTLDEKGEYELTVSVNAGGIFKRAQFGYTVK